MLGKRWLGWLIILIALIGVSQGIGWLLAGQGYGIAAASLMAAGGLAAYLWLVGGVFALAQPRWLLWTLIHLGLGMAGTALAASFYRAPSLAIFLMVVTMCARGALVYRAYATRLNWRWPAMTLLAVGDVLALVQLGWAFEQESAAIAIAGIFCMALAFLAGLWLIRLILSPGKPILGVARTLVEEAVRTKIVLVLIVLLMLIVPVLPYAGEREEILKYRIGTFLAWSLWATTILLSLMTVFLACWTICGDMRFRQVHLTMTKPVGRLQYLLGKWVGICLLDLLLIVVAAGGIYTFARIMEQEKFMPYIADHDRQAVTDQVLTARISVLPELPGGLTLAKLVARRFRHLADEGLFDLTKAITDEQSDEALTRELNYWHSIEYLGRQTYIFRNLNEAKETVETVQLKLKPAANEKPDIGMIWFRMQINGREFRVPQLVLDQVHVLPIETSLIDDLGKLEITIINQHPVDKSQTHKTEISFTPDEGLQLLFRYGAFGPNLARGILMIWVQLCFLAMVGLAAGTFLGFPVASLLCLTVYVIAVLKDFLIEALTGYAGVGGTDEGLWQLIMGYPLALSEKLAAGEVWDAIKVLIQLAGEAIVGLVPSFNEYSPTPLIADGQAVRFWASRDAVNQSVGLFNAVVWVGIVCTSIFGGIAWLIFRRRELARVTV